MTGIDSGKYKYPTKPRPKSAAAASMRKRYRGDMDDEDEDDLGFILSDEEDGDDVEDKPLVIVEGQTPKLVVLRYYWGAHQRFFRSLCVSLKVPCAIAVAKHAISEVDGVNTS